MKPHGVAVLVVMLGFVPTASAQRWVLLEPGGDPGVPSAVREAVLAEIEHGLDSAGVEPVRSGSIEPALPAALGECTGRSCVQRVLEHAEAVAAVAVSIWFSDDRRPSHVAVAVITPEAVYEHTAEVRGSIPDAAAEAFGEAFVRHRLGPGPWLSIEGGHLGARVRVDGRLVGSIPWRGRVEPGVRRVVVEGREGPIYQGSVRIETNPGAFETLVISGDEESQPSGGRSSIHIIGPVFLGVAGAGLLALDAVALARMRCGIEDNSGDCVSGRRLRPGPFAAYAAVGAAALGGAIVWGVLRRRSEPKVAVAVQPLGLSMRAEF